MSSSLAESLVRLALSDVFNVASDPVVIWRKEVSESFVIVEKAIAIFVEAFADDGA